MSNVATIDAQATGTALPMNMNAGGVLTPMDMLNRAVESGANIEVLTKLMDLQERFEANQARKAFDEAMAAAKAEIPTIRKNRTVDFTSAKGRTHYRHEDLAEVAATVNPVLSRYGLSYRFRTSAQPNEPITVTCIVTHRLGYFEETTLCGPRDDSGNKNAIQQVGSTLTYLQRMTLKAALGLAASDDDDGRKSDQTAEPISKEEVSKLLAEIETTGTDTEQFCKYLGVEAVPEITVGLLPRAKAALAKKREKINA